MRILLTSQLFLFYFSGFLSFTCNITSRYILSQFFSYNTSIVLAYLIGMFVAFSLFKFWVFKDKKGETIKQGSYYILINIIGILQTLSVASYLRLKLLPQIDLNSHADEIAHILGLGCVSITSFLGHKYFTFKQK